MTRSEFKAAYSPKPTKPVAHIFGLFVWRGDGRYASAQALATYKNEKIAQRAADKRNAAGEHDGNIVVRWAD